MVPVLGDPRGPGAPRAPGPVSYLLVGLGNPGKAYDLTRHNAGFLFLDFVCETLGASARRAKFRSLVGEATLAGTRALLLRPQTFMNLSGEAVAAAASFYRLGPSRVIVCCDDVNLPAGVLRIRLRGSDGGHRGLRSVADALGSDDFPRVRFGTGDRADRGQDLADWVLSPFPAADLALLRSLFPSALAGVESLVKGDTAAAVRTCGPPIPAP